MYYGQSYLSLSAGFDVTDVIGSRLFNSKLQ